MLEYKTNDLIKKAMHLCDLKNNSFLTDEMSVQLLNDSYTQCYQKLIDVKHDDIIKSVDVKNGDELPEDLYQIAEVYYINNNNPFKKYNLVKNRDFMLKNGKILFKDVYGGCTYCIDYFPTPDKLTLNEDGDDTMSWYYHKSMHPFSTSVFTQLGKYIYITDPNDNFIDVIEYGKTDFKKINTNAITDVFTVNNSLAMFDGENILKFNKSGEYETIPSENAPNVYDADEDVFSYDADVTNKKVILNGTEYTFEKPYITIKWGDDGFLCAKDDFIDIVDLDCVVIDTVTVESNKAIVGKVTDLENCIYGFFNDTGAIYTRRYKPFEGTNILTVPNNAFYSLLAYDLAVMMKTIAGEDISALSVLRDNAYNTFADTMKKDIAPYVIEDVYGNNSGWWF